MAHTALCVIEALRVKEDVSEILGKRGINWKLLLTALILHDTGKLSKEYTSKSSPRFHHNEASAQMAHDILGKLQERGRIGVEEKKIVSCACFLHMEYYEWRNMLRAGFSSLSQVTSPGAVVEFADDVWRPLENLKLVLAEAGMLDDDLEMALSEGSKIKSLKLKPSTYSLNSLNRQSVLKTVALHWFILIFDNRASSARGGANLYWIRVVRDAMKSLPESEARADKVIEFSDHLLSRMRGRITPLPRIELTDF